jgi:hypothetical protein
MKKIHSNIIGRVRNHAGYVSEEDEFSKNSDDLYITNEARYIFEADMLRVDKNEVVISYVKNLKTDQARLKTEKQPKVRKDYRKYKIWFVFGT